MVGDRGGLQRALEFLEVHLVVSRTVRFHFTSTDRTRVMLFKPRDKTFSMKCMLARHMQGLAAFMNIVLTDGTWFTTRTCGTFEVVHGKSRRRRIASSMTLQNCPHKFSHNMLPRYMRECSLQNPFNSRRNSSYSWLNIWG